MTKTKHRSFFKKILSSVVLFFVFFSVGLAFIVFVPIPYTATEVYTIQEPYTATESYTEVQPYAGKEYYLEEVPVTAEECYNDVANLVSAGIDPYSYFIRKGIDILGSGEELSAESLFQTCQSVVQYQTMQKSRDVIKYQEVTKEREVVKYRSVRKEREVNKWATLLQRITGQVEYYYEVDN